MKGFLSRKKISGILKSSPYHLLTESFTQNVPEIVFASRLIKFGFNVAFSPESLKEFFNLDVNPQSRNFISIALKFCCSLFCSVHVSLYSAIKILFVKILKIDFYHLHNNLMVNTYLIKENISHVYFFLVKHTVTFLL